MPTAIPWTDETWNPWQGCNRVSRGCKNCYMYREKIRFHQDPTQVVRSSQKTFDKPLTLEAGTWVFTCSWSDFFHPIADPWRAEAWKIIRDCPEIVFIILTKRPERIAEQLPGDWGTGYHNVILGITAEDQANYNHRWSILREIPARVYVISHEPAVGFITYSGDFLSLKNRAWVIAGGETGPDADPSHVYWFRWDRDQCRDAANVPFFFKSWGEWIHGTAEAGGGYRLQNGGYSAGLGVDLHKWKVGGASVKVGRKHSGHKLDHREFREFPDIQIEQNQVSLFQGVVSANE